MSDAGFRRSGQESGVIYPVERKENEADDEDDEKPITVCKSQAKN